MWRNTPFTFVRFKPEAVIILGMVAGKFPSEILPIGFCSCEILLMKSSQVCPGPKNYVIVSLSSSYSRQKTSCTVVVDKVKHLHFCCIICEFIFFC